MELWITTPDVNLGKLVPLKVHGRLGNAKIAKDGSRAGPRLLRKSDPSPFGNLSNIRLVSMRST